MTNLIAAGTIAGICIGTSLFAHLGCAPAGGLKETTLPPPVHAVTTPGSTSRAPNGTTGGDPSKVPGTDGGTTGQDDKTKTGSAAFIPDRVYQLSKLQRVTCKVDKHVFHLWVMDTDSKREEGMMFLKDDNFKDDDGMIFIFANEGVRRFWMHNTLVDLDVTYNDKEGKILNVFTMKKLDETTDYSSKGPAMSVIELKAKILKKLGIEPGMKWEIPEDVVSKDNGNK